VNYRQGEVQTGTAILFVKERLFTIAHWIFSPDLVLVVLVFVPVFIVVSISVFSVLPMLVLIVVPVMVLIFRHETL